MEGMDECYYYSDSGESLDAYDQEQLEIALYCKIHFETNLEDSGIIEECVNSDFDILVEGNDNSGYKASESNAEYVLNRDLEKKYESVLNENDADKPDEGEGKTKSLDIKKVNKAKQVTEEVKKSNQIQSSLRKPNVHIIFDETSSSDSDNQDVILGESSDDDDGNEDIQINVHTGESTSTPRYTYTKMSAAQSDTDEEKDGSDHWAINEEDVFKDKGVTPYGRYYKPVRCHNCNYVGHLSKNCPKPKKAIVCALCADEGHICRNCPRSFCHNCEEAGHDSKYCTAPRRKWNRSCRRCQMPGHDEKECSEIWRQYHVTIRPGNIKKFKLSRKRKRISCYNCGDEGHYGHECEEDRMNRFLRVNSPFITRYQNVKQFCDVMNSVRSDDVVEQSEDTNKDGGWKSFDDIDAHVNTLRENKHKMAAGEKMGDKNSAETKKQSQYLHMVKKSGKLHTGRNNFDKMSFTILNEPSVNLGEKKLKKRKTSKAQGKEDLSVIDAKAQRKEDLSVIDLTSKETRRDRQRKRKLDSKLREDEQKCIFSNKLDEEDYPRNNKSEIDPNHSGQAAKGKKIRKLDTSKNPASTNVQKCKGKTTDNLASKARTVSYDHTLRGGMSITTKRTPVKSSTKSSINDIAADSNKHRSEFSANHLFSLESNHSKGCKDNQSDVRPRISKKHVSHRNDNYAADDLFSLQKISKMQASGDIDQPVEEIDVDHQVHNNEWWNKGKKKRNRGKRNNHTRF